MRDPYCGSYPQISPYAFGLNNPVFYTDDEGNKIYDFRRRLCLTNDYYILSIKCFRKVKSLIPFS